MKKYLLLLLPVIYLVCACSPRSRTAEAAIAPIDSVWVSHVKTLFENLADDFGLDDRPLLVSTAPERGALSGCFNGIFESLSRLDIHQYDTLGWKNEFNRVIEWDSLFFGDRFALVPGDTIQNIFMDMDRWWNYFWEHIGPGFITYSVPVFFQDYGYALVYISEQHGGLAGFGAWYIMKRKDNRWVMVSEHCIWIS